MKKLIIAAALVAASIGANAACRANDRFGGNDKTLHFGGGAVISTLVTVHTADPWKGFYAGAAAGVVKEAVDSTGAGDCSLQDLIVTVAGAAVGAYTGSVIVTRLQGRTLVAYTKSF